MNWVRLLWAQISRYSCIPSGIVRQFKAYWFTVRFRGKTAKPWVGIPNREFHVWKVCARLQTYKIIQLYKIMHQLVSNYVVKLIPFWRRVRCSSTRSKSQRERLVELKINTRNVGEIVKCKCHFQSRINLLTNYYFYHPITGRSLYLVQNGNTKRNPSLG